MIFPKQSSRRKSSESLASTNSGSECASLADSNSTQTSADSHTAVQSLFDRLEYNHDGSSVNKISLLTSLKSLFYIHSLIFDCSQEGDLWRIDVTAQLHTGAKVHASARSTTKKQAKQLAAEEVYPQVRDDCLQSLPPDNAAKESCKVVESKNLTVKQAAIVQSAALELQQLQRLAHQVLSLQARTTVFLSIDVEAYEYNKSQVTEIGLAWIYADDIFTYNNTAHGQTKDKIHSHHFIVEDNVHLRNGHYVPDHKDDYNFGVSETVPEAMVASRLNQLMNDICGIHSEVVLVGHSLNGDIDWLKAYGVSLSETHLPTLDVAVVYQALTQDHKRTKLASLASLYGISGFNFHNGANDAYYTLEVMVRMMIRTVLSTIMGGAENMW